MVIDTHAHIIVPEITRDAAPSEVWRPRVYWENDRQVIDYAGKKIRSAVNEFVNVEAILQAQSEAGVDRVLLCPWVSILRYNTETEDGLFTSRIQNTSLAGMAQAYPDRVSALGIVPLQDPELAARELRSLMQEPGLFGVEISASVNGKYLGDDRFRPFWAAAEESGALVFIHPTIRGLEASAFNEYYMWNSVGNPLETTITAAHMIMAGIMEEHKHLKVLLAHGGGSILALRGRLRHAHSFQSLAQARLEESPETSLKRFYFDTLTHDLTLLRELIEYVGSDHVLVGSDYPFDMGSTHPTDIVNALNLPEEDTFNILSGNASRLLELESK